MGTELTAKLEELRREIESDINRGRMPSSNSIDAIDQCIALSQQPPVYAMSRDYARLYDHLVKGWEAFAKRDHPFLSGFRHPIGLELVRGNIETRNEAYRNEVFHERGKFVRWCQNVSIEWLAPSPQAVTVEGIEKLLNDIEYEWPFLPKPSLSFNEYRRTRLDQYMNQR